MMSYLFTDHERDSLHVEPLEADKQIMLSITGKSVRLSLEDVQNLESALYDLRYKMQKEDKEKGDKV